MRPFEDRVQSFEDECNLLENFGPSKELWDMGRDPLPTPNFVRRLSRRHLITPRPPTTPPVSDRHLDTTVGAGLITKLA